MHHALETIKPLEPDDLHLAILELAISYRKHFEIILPPLNAPLLTFKHVKRLLLPLEVYAGARRIARELELDFTWPNTYARHRIHTLPELQVMALVVISTKLTQSLDDLTRLPWSASDPSTTTVDWSIWAEQFQAEEEIKTRRKNTVSVTSNDVLTMDDKEIDHYLDWYQSVWIEKTDLRLPEQILDLFPLPNMSETPAVDRVTAQRVIDETHAQGLSAVQSSLVWHEPVSLDESEKYATPRRPGSAYRRYRRMDDMSGHARRFHEEAAACAGVTPQSLVRAVRALEQKLMKTLANREVL
jgi:RNA polymerase I-specific transcription initiation factor RRN7